MKSIRKFGILITLSILISSSFAGCTSSSAASSSAPAAASSSLSAVTALQSSAAENTSSDSNKLKVALILPGSKSDASWNAGAYNGLEWLKSKQPDIETTYVENISNDNLEAALVNYAEEGYNVIFAFSGDYTANLVKVAKQYPNIYFADTDLTSGLKLPANVTTINGDQSQASFLVGAIAGYLSKTNKVGTVEGFESATLSTNTVSFIQGAKYVKPDIQVINSYIGSWSDVEKAKQTTLAQIQSGVGFVYASGDAIGLGIIGAAKEKGIPVVGYGTDLNSLAPKQVITSVIWNVGVTFNEVVKDVKNKQFKNTLYSPGLKENAVYLADYHGTVPDDIAAKVKKVQDKLISGEISVKN